LGGVYPRDLLLVGAATGVGKTALAVDMALSGAKAGREVYLFALEAEEGEVADRLYYNLLGQLAKDPRLDFAGWSRGEHEDITEQYHDQIVAELTPLLGKLHVLYKGKGDFTALNLSQRLEGVANLADMVVLDHVHVIDVEGSESELRAQAKTVRLLRDLALDGELPIVAVSHLRKKGVGERNLLLPDIDDLHGTSTLSKVATQVVLFSRDWDGPRPKRHLSPTLIKIAKDRRGRAGPYVARIYYDLSSGGYESAYEIGRVEWQNRKQCWTRLPVHNVPSWAVHDAGRLSAEIPI
jgi:replicative DNA helicase